MNKNYTEKSPSNSDLYTGCVIFVTMRIEKVRKSMQIYEKVCRNIKKIQKKT